MYTEIFTHSAFQMGKVTYCNYISIYVFIQIIVNYIEI